MGTSLFLVCIAVGSVLLNRVLRALAPPTQAFIELPDEVPGIQALRITAESGMRLASIEVMDRAGMVHDVTLRRPSRTVVIGSRR